jgi:hypothetical protein
MTGQTVILVGQSQRDFAHRLIDAAPENAVVNVRGPSRNKDQNAKMWAMLSDISRAGPEGKTGWNTDIWKCGFMSALGHEAKLYPGIDGAEAFYVQRSSKLTVPEMADLITFIQEDGDRHGVKWSEFGE